MFNSSYFHTPNTHLQSTGSSSSSSSNANLFCSSDNSTYTNLSSNGNQSDLATILQFVGPICAAAIQKNNAQLADILSQFTNALAKPFPHALTDVANYVSSLSSNSLSAGPAAIPMTSAQVNLKPVVSSQIKTPSTPTRSIPTTNIIPSSPMEESSPGSWLQGYMNWYSEEIESETEYSDFRNAWRQLQERRFTKSALKNCTIEDWEAFNIPLYLGRRLQKRLPDYEKYCMHTLDKHTSKSQPPRRFYKSATQFPPTPLNIPTRYSSTTPSSSQPTAIQASGLSFYTPQATTQSLPPVHSHIYNNGTPLPSITQVTTPSTSLTNHTVTQFPLPSFSTNQSIFSTLQGPPPQSQWGNLPRPSISQLPNTLQNFLRDNNSDTLAQPILPSNFSNLGSIFSSLDVLASVAQKSMEGE